MRLSSLIPSLTALFLLSGCADPESCEIPDDPLGTPTSWEQAWLDSSSGSESPDPQWLTAEDGLALAYHSWPPEADPSDPQAPIVLLVHGSSAYGALYSTLGQGLAARGVRARLIDLRGHGRSVCASSTDCEDPASIDRSIIDDDTYFIGRLGDSLDRNQIIRDLSVHIEDLRAQWPEASVTLAGHSSGGGVVSRYVEHSGVAAIDQVALIAPFNHFEQPQNTNLIQDCAEISGTAYAQVSIGALGDAMRGNTHRYVLHFNKSETYTADLDVLAYTYSTLEGMAASDASTFLAAHTAPTLWVAGDSDALMDLEISQDQFDMLPGGQAFVSVEDTSHIGLIWSDGVADLLAQWAADPLSIESGSITP